MGLFDSTLFGSSTSGLCGSCNGQVGAAVAAWTQRLDYHLTDHFLTAEEEADLRAYQAQLGLHDADLAGVLPRLHRAKYLSSVLSGVLPTVYPHGIMLRRGEVCHYASVAAMYIESYHHVAVDRQGHVRGFVSHSYGGAYKVVGGTTMAGQGQFLVTNHAAVFVSEREWRCPFDYIRSYHYYDNALEIVYDGRQHRETFALTDGQLAAATIVGAKRVAEAGSQ